VGKGGCVGARVGVGVGAGDPLQAASDNVMSKPAAICAARCDCARVRLCWFMCLILHRNGWRDDSY
jgi:hypothetical protein